MFKETKQKVIQNSHDLKMVRLDDQAWMFDRLIWEQILMEIDDISNGKTLIVLRNSNKSGIAIGDPLKISEALGVHDIPLLLTNVIRTYRRKEYGRVFDMFRLKSIKDSTKELEL